MKKRLGVVSVVTLLIMALFALSALATSAEMYFSTDKNGQNRVTNIQEGEAVWIVIYDPDENIDCDVRDKIWTEIKLMDPKTGAYLVWVSYDDDNNGANAPNLDPNGLLYSDPLYTPFKGHSPGDEGSYSYDYLEETGSDTGLFVSKRSFQVGTREDYDVQRMNTHVVDNGTYNPTGAGAPAEPWMQDFQFGHYTYFADGLNGNGSANDGLRGWWSGSLLFTPGMMPWAMMTGPVLPDTAIIAPTAEYLVGRFENMDTLVGMYQDRNDDSDVALGMMKIDDHEAVIAWDSQIYKDANGSATITVTDYDENLNCNEVEYVPVFIIVNPGSWNPVVLGPPDSPANFCMLKRTGGVTGVIDAAAGDNAAVGTSPIRWYNIYHSQLNSSALAIGGSDNRYYIEYPVAGDTPANVVAFDTVQEGGITAVSFYAQETGVDTGVFQLNLNSILDDLGFNSLRVRDVLVAYYLDPNDEDDFKLATAYIEERQHSITSFTNAQRGDQELYWIGRDPVYVQVIDSNANVDPCCPEQVVVHICDPHEEDDSEWWILDETSSNSPVFFSNAGMVLDPVWDALGVGINPGIAPAGTGGYQLQLDNWKLEVYNEDDVYARYNDVYYVANETEAGLMDGLNFLGDITALGQLNTAFPPAIERVRVGNDVSFDLMSIADTQVYDGQTSQMWFLDRQGNRVNGFVNSDCVFVEVLDPDQDEDQLRRERIDAFWDGQQNFPFGPENDVPFACDADYTDLDHEINNLLGMVNIFNNGLEAKLYVLNPRSGFWAAVDLLETGVATGDFVSTICIDLTSAYSDCVPTLRVLPGDTIVAVYQDPSNHSDSAWISIKVGIGGGGTPPTQQSSTMFVDSAGVEVTNYTDADMVYVKVVDPSHAGATVLANAVEIDGTTYDLGPLAGAQNDTFITAGLSLALVAGSQITATYGDPTDPTDTSSDTITIIASELDVVSFYAGPNPFDATTTFGYDGSGIASVMSVTVYDLAGKIVWSEELANVTGIDWDGTDEGGAMLANGGYIYAVTATDGTNTFTGRGTVFINR